MYSDRFYQKKFVTVNDPKIFYFMSTLRVKLYVFDNTTINRLVDTFYLSQSWKSLNLKESSEPQILQARTCITI